MALIDWTVGTAIGQRIATAYRAAGMNRSQLAKAIGAGYSNVWRWETGEAAPSIESLALVAKATGTTIDWLQRGEDADRPEEPEPCPEFARWLAELAPGDLTALERRTLAAWAIPTPHPGPSFYSVALAAWRGGLSQTDARRAAAYTERHRGRSPKRPR